MKKVLMFLQSGVGGAERITVTIGKNLDKEKFDVSFCLVGDTNGNLSIKNFIPEEYRILEVPKAKGLKLFSLLWKVLKQEKPEVVFSSVTHINTKLLACSPFFRDTKFVIRNNNYLYTLSKIQLIVMNFFYRFANSVVAQTDEMALELVRQLKLPQNKVFALPNPVDTKTIEEKKNAPTPFKDSSKKIYVATGRFHPVKGFDILVKAFSLVLQRQPNAELHILGNITDNCEKYYEEILGMVRQLDISERVFFDGFQQNPYVYMKNADCFVLSSRNEGLPNVLIESLYLGTPVAATTCIPVISRIVRNGVNGFLAETENAESLANAMYEASLLGRIESCYQAAKLDEFQRLFE